MLRRFNFFTAIIASSNFFPYHRSSSSSSSKLQQQSPSLDSIIGKCVASNDYQKAVGAILEEASKPEGKVSLSSLKATMFVCERNNKHQQAIDLAKKLDREKKLATSAWDEAALTTLLRLQVSVGDLDGAAICLKMILASIKRNRSVDDSKGEKLLKRRSIAPLIEGYRNFLSSSSSQADKIKNDYYSSCAVHLYGECQKYQVELHVEDLENFASVFHLIGLRSTVKNSAQQKTKESELKLHITNMIREFVNHTPILHDQQQQQQQTESTASEAASNGNYSSKADLDKFESVLRLCEGENETRVFKDCAVDGGTCSGCGSKLDATPLTREDAKQLQHDIETSLIQHACARTPRREHAIRAGFKAFQNHVLTHRPDIFLDGANLGYYGLSSWYHLAKQEKLNSTNNTKTGEASNGKNHAEKNRESDDVVKFDKKKCTFVDVSPNLHFVDLAVQEVEKQGRKPLVVLHERHLEARNLLPSYVPIVEKWKRNRIVFATPSGLNDDICWLWGIVAPPPPTASSFSASSAAAANSSSMNHRLVLTNDAMRDHHFALLSRRAFLRLRDRKQVTFSAKWTGSATQLCIDPVPTYSTFIQKNGKKWHVPYYEKNVDIDRVEENSGSEADDDDEHDVVVKWKCF